MVICTLTHSHFKFFKMAYRSHSRRRGGRRSRRLGSYLIQRGGIRL